MATGITMEFSFGTNWADYSRFVGDIFGAPLAAEALFAFFLESVFLGVLLFGRKQGVQPCSTLVSAWLVWARFVPVARCGSSSRTRGCRRRPALSWPPTASKAVITDFLAAAFNPSTLPRYTHVVVALLIMGAFAAMAVGAWYLLQAASTPTSP